MRQYKLYKLDASTKTGIELIDTQHRELFDRVNDLVKALVLAKGKEEVQGMIGFLDSYVSVHLSAEEDMMLKKKYPKYTPHKIAHEKFVENIMKLKNETAKNGVTLQLATIVSELIGDWFFNHIKMMDMQYVPYLSDSADNEL